MLHVLGVEPCSKFQDVRMHHDSNNSATHCALSAQNCFSDAKWVVLDSLVDEKADACVQLADALADCTSVPSVD